MLRREPDEREGVLSMRAYLDHASTTALRPEARDAWLTAASVIGNASSIHGGGQDARRLLEESREALAEVVDCDPIEVVFTSGGTESINLAVKGLWWSRRGGAEAIVLPDAEHHATIDAVEWLTQQESAHAVRVSVDDDARIDVVEFEAACRMSGVALATALVANNECGTINDAAGLAAIADAAHVPLHLDAVAAFGHIPISFAQWRSDARGPHGLIAMSLSAHKIGGPIGVGALVVARAAESSALLHGGGQQRSLRAGTQDVAGAAAFAVAAQCAQRERIEEASRLSGLRERLIRGIVEAVPSAVLLGDPVHRLPGNAHVLFPAARGESLLFLMDRAGVAVSTGSACQAGVSEPSHVVLAMGRPEADARSVLRLTLGATSTVADVDAFIDVLPEAFARASASSRP